MDRAGSIRIIADGIFHLAKGIPPGKMKPLIIFTAIFIIFTALLSIWISPLYEKEKPGLFPYLATAFSQCIEQKTLQLANQLAMHGGFLSQKVGVANEITIEKELEIGMYDALAACENLLQREETFDRELSGIRAGIDPMKITVLFDGRWKSKSMKTIPGFSVSIRHTLGEASQLARELIKSWDETGLIRNIVLETLGRDYSAKQTADVLLMHKEESNGYIISFEVAKIEADNIKRTIMIPLTVIMKKMKKDSGEEQEFRFYYPFLLAAKDLQVGCEILSPQSISLPPAKEILFDCGWYSCTINWAENISLPRLCAGHVIYLDGKQYEG